MSSSRDQRTLKPARFGGLLRPAAHLPLLAAGAASLAGFVLANPYSLLSTGEFLAGFGGQYGWAFDPYRTSDLSMPLMILRALSAGTSPILLGAAALGLALLAFRRPREALLLASFPLAYVAFFLLGADLFYARFAIPLLPFVCILAAWGVVGWTVARGDAETRGRGDGETGRRGDEGNSEPRTQNPELPQDPGLGTPHPAPRTPHSALLTAVAVALLALPPLVADVKHNSLLRVEDTRQLLGRWIEANVPPDSRLAVEGYSFLDTRGQRMGPKRLPYSLEILPSLRVHPLDYYMGDRFHYLVTSSHVYGRYRQAADAHRHDVDWYRQLEERLSPVASFFPTDDGRELPFLMDEELTPIYTVLERDRPGPTLKVYRVGETPRHDVRWLDVAVPERVSAGQRLALRITLRNQGNLAWPHEGYTPVRVGYRWLDTGGQEVPAPDLRSPLPARVEPGETVVVRVEAQAPATPGSYTLRLDLVQENFAWLSTKGASIMEIEVAIG